MKQKSHALLWFTASCALLGALLSTWLAPKCIAWYFDPPAQFGVSCVGPIEWAMSRLRAAQVMGIIIGGVAGLLLFYARFRGHKDKTSDET